MSIYDFASDSVWISLHMRDFFISLFTPDLITLWQIMYWHNFIMILTFSTAFSCFLVSLFHCIQVLLPMLYKWISSIWCNVSPSPTDVSPNENSWMLHPLDKVSLVYCAPDPTIPSLNTDFLIAFCDTHALCGPCVTQSRVGTHRSGAQYPRDALFKGRNIQELSVGDTSIGDTSTLHPVSYSIVYGGCTLVYR